MNRSWVKLEKMKIPNIILLSTLLLFNYYSAIAMEGSSSTPDHTVIPETTSENHSTPEPYDPSEPTEDSLVELESALINMDFPNAATYQKYVEFLLKLKYVPGETLLRIVAIKKLFEYILKLPTGIKFETSFENAHLLNTTREDSSVFCKPDGSRLSLEEVGPFLLDKLNIAKSITIDWQGKGSVTGNKVVSAVVSFCTEGIVGMKISQAPSLKCIKMVFNYNDKPANPENWSLKTAYPTRMIEYRVGNMKFTQ